MLAVEVAYLSVREFGFLNRFLSKPKIRTDW